MLSLVELCLLITVLLIDSGHVILAFAPDRCVLPRFLEHVLFLLFGCVIVVDIQNRIVPVAYVSICDIGFLP